MALKNETLRTAFEAVEAAYDAVRELKGDGTAPLDPTLDLVLDELDNAEIVLEDADEDEV